MTSYNSWYDNELVSHSKKDERERNQSLIAYSFYYANVVARNMGLALGQHSSEETSQQWRAIGDTMPDLTGPRIEPEI